MTMPDDFILLDPMRTRISFMKLRGHKFSYASVGKYGIKALKMPYKCSGKTMSFSMLIMLPDEMTGLPGLLQRIKSDLRKLLNEVNKKLKIEKVDYHKSPKFRFEHEFMPSYAMKSLGLTLPFDPDASNFDGIVESGLPFCASRMVQKSLVELREKGTEAVSLTHMPIDTRAPRKTV
ncbi:hypothetical protein Droror1_Dr00016808 [Drosera rotundifolia]